MKRRYLLKQAGWLTAGSMLTESAAAATINNKNKKLVAKEQLINTILQSKATVILTIGAGDIGEWVLPIKKALDEKIF